MWCTFMSVTASVQRRHQKVLLFPVALILCCRLPCSQPFGGTLPIREREHLKPYHPALEGQYLSPGPLLGQQEAHPYGNSSGLRSW